jgi:MFS family permease
VSWGVLYYTFSVLVVPMEAELDASRGELSLAFTLAVVARALSAPLVGAWIDRRGVRSLMTAGALAGSALTLAWSSVQGLASLYAVFVGIGVATSAVLYEPAFAAVARWFRGHERARAVLAITLVAGFASTIFLPAAAVLTDLLGWRGALRVLAGILAVATVGPHLLLGDPPPREVPAPPSRPAQTGDGTAGAPTGGSATEVTSFEAGVALRTSALWWLTTTFVCGRVPIVAVSVHLPALLVERGETATVAATLTGLIGAFSVAGRVLITVAGTRVSWHVLLGLVYVLQAAACVVFVVVPGGAVALLFVVVFGLGFGTTTITRPVMLADRFGAMAYGTIAGVVAGVVTAFEAASPLAVGVARDLAGTYQPALLGLAVVLALGTVASFRCAPGRA